jgi:hypothetical protein
MGEKRVLIVDGCGGDPELEVLRKVFEGLVDEVREGKIVGCPHCNHLMVAGSVCETCSAMQVHKKGCRFLAAISCPIEIECTAHGRGVCPECDACNCAELP